MEDAPKCTGRLVDYGVAIGSVYEHESDIRDCPVCGLVARELEAEGGLQ
jgi:hypothetical protein